MAQRELLIATIAGGGILFYMYGRNSKRKPSSKSLPPQQYPPATLHPQGKSAPFKHLIMNCREQCLANGHVSNFASCCGNGNPPLRRGNNFYCTDTGEPVEWGTACCDE